MYLHLGQDVVVRGEDIIGIFDIENTSVSKITKEYLAAQEKARRVINVSTELPKSFIVCRQSLPAGPSGARRAETRVYVSQISCATLKKRSGFIQQIRLDG